MSLGVFDLETTGTDPETARIVTAYLGFMDDDGRITDARSWLVDPGVEIPEGAAAIHGITTEIARRDGMSAAAAVAEIESELYLAFAQDIPLVVYNARYDLTVLDREIGRHHGTIPAYGDPRPILDPLVIDRALDRFRPGGRTLAAAAAHHGITIDGDLHSASFDATLAGRLALKLLEDPKIAGRDPHHVHARSIALAQDQTIRLRDYHRSIGKDVTRGYRTEWPVIPR